MRIPHWRLLVCGWMLAAMAVGPAAFADEFDDEYASSEDYPEEDASGLFSEPEYEAPVAPVGRPVYPAEYMPGGPPAPYPSGAYPPPLPQEAVFGPYSGAEGVPPPSAWPHVSPLMLHNQDQLYNDRGLWVNDSDFGPRRRYHFAADFLLGHMERPGNQILGDSRLTNFLYPTDDAFPFPPFSRLDIAIYGEPQPFPQWPFRKTMIFRDLKHYGTRLTYGWDNYDDSGVNVSGFYLFELQEEFRRGSPATGSPFDVDLNNFRIALDNGSELGRLIPFDGDFRMFYDQMAAGVDVDAYMTPFFDTKGFDLRLSYGAKYLFINEKFHFIATDSGLDYTWNVEDEAIDNIAFLIDPFSTQIGSEVWSHLVGPFIGLRYDLGGEHFKIWGQTKGGVAANLEKIRVEGINVRDQVDQFLFGPGPHTVVEKEHARLSPFFETSINAEFPLFKLLPVLNKVRMLNTANFRVGYNVVLVGELSRPTAVIRYTYDTPTIQTKRTTFHIDTVNFGLDWKF